MAAATSLSVQIVHQDRQVRLVAIGEIDVHSASTFTAAADLAIEEHPQHLHIDLTNVNFMDSSGARGIQMVIASAAAVGVPSTVVGRCLYLTSDDALARPMTVWSGSTTRLIAVPRA